MTKLTISILVLCTFLGGFWAGYVRGHGRALAWAHNVEEAAHVDLMELIKASKLLLIFVLLALPLKLPAPSITGMFFEITQSTLDQTPPSGGPLHFRNCPMDRNKIISQLAQFGSPWIGWAISGSASSPCFVLHRTEFPHQGQGNPEVRMEGVQNDVNALVQSVVEVEGATDDDGNEIEAVHYHAQIHFFQHNNDNQQVFGGTYLPGIDYTFKASDNPITRQWWIQD